MKTKTLNGILKFVGKISNPSSVTSLYRAVQLGPTCLRSVSEFGNLYVQLPEDTGLKGDVLLDTSSLQAITQSLPQDGELVLEQDTNKINWSCGDAKGHLNFVVTDHKIPEIPQRNTCWSPPQNLGIALQLASCACQWAAVSVGLYGISIEPVDDKLYLMSSNTFSLAATTIEKGSFPTDKITVRPPVPSVVAALLQEYPEIELDVDENGIYLIGDCLVA